MKEEYIETRPQPAYIICNIDEYYDLNRALSQAKGYDLSNKTQRCKSMNPRAAKVDIQYDVEGNETGYTAKVVFPVSSQEQIDYPELFAGYELVSSYIPTGEEIYEFIVNMMSMETIGWTVEQMKESKGIGKEVILYINQELAAMLPDEVSESMAEIGLNINVIE